MIAECARTSRPVPRIIAIVVLMAAIAALPATAAANAGTPLMWVSTVHLLFGNAIIGMVEATIILLLLRVNKPALRLGMVVANYVSALTGGIILDAVGGPIWQLSINHLVLDLALVYGATFVLTVLIELPFALVCIGLANWRKPAFLGAFLVSQVITYAVLALIYMQVASASLAFKTTKDPSLRFLKPFAGYLYFIGADDGDLYRMDLADRTRVEQLAVLDTDQYNDRPFAHRNKPDQPWHLGVMEHDSRRDLGRLDGQDILPRNWGFGGGGDLPRATISLDEAPTSWMNWRGVARVPASSDSGYKLHVGHWAAEGLSIVRSTGSDEKPRRLALETPLLDWPIRNATLLPDDIVIFQLGRNQIVALDLKTDTVGLLARGRGPLVTERVAASGS